MFEMYVGIDILVGKESGLFLSCSGFDVGLTKLWDYNNRGVSYEEIAMR